ncbi:uncharacterized protein LOC133824574 [Humulus lupulus]|uniref:uncharacterized protein LOC133824574 n=1 Tax=Humulus lupulus TaxID=3486 RepID=UPI002B41287B|nr:uncharacterized protein LOC133824574 [Humulus lupulus]
MLLKNNGAPGTVAQIAPATNVGEQIDMMCRLLEASQQRSDEAIRTLTEAQARLEAKIAKLQRTNEATRTTQDKESLNLDGTGTQVIQIDSPERNARHIREGSQGPMPSSPAHHHQRTGEQRADRCEICTRTDAEPAKTAQLDPEKGPLQTQARAPQDAVDEVHTPSIRFLESWKEEMLQEVMQKFSDGRSAYASDYVDLVTRITEKSPFAEWIQNEPKPRDFVIPPLPAFNGKGDPLNHLFQFQQKMALEVNNEALQCKVFSTTFSGPALLWFKQLKPSSVSSFEDLRRTFLRQYNANCEAPRTMADLYQIEQGENEHPKSYLQRFIDLVHQIHNAKPATSANLFVKSLQVGSLLHENLTMTPPYDMAKIQTRAEGVFRVLEFREHAQKKSALISTPPENNHPPPSTRDDKRKMQELDHMKGGKKPRTS